MTFRLYIFTMSIASTGAWIAWIVVLHAIDPTKTSTLGFFLFYLTLAIALIGTLSMFGAGIRAWRRPQEHPSRHTLKSFRHALLLSTLIVVSLFLVSAGLLRWWSLLLSVLIAALLELIYLSLKQRT